MNLVVHKDSIITELREELRSKRRYHTRETKRLDTALVAAAAPALDNPNADFLVEYKGKATRYMTNKSGWAVALRRNIGNASAKDTHQQSRSFLGAAPPDWPEPSNTI